MTSIDKLYKEFLHLFHPTASISVNDGWTDLLRELFTKIDTRVKTRNLREFMISQVKEKFGILRCYCEGGDDEIDNAIIEAERTSAKTCEYCGRSGSLVHMTHWWVKTACPECCKSQQKQQIK